ncbi:MAG: hypothetical protein P8J87_14395 [Verrucomicrobiales bacterium]|nr:hypothetical protein [Verrucomicrobiales bacterium]
MRPLLLLLIFTSLVSAKPVNEQCLIKGKRVDPEHTSKVTVLVGFCCNNCAADSKDLENRAKMGAVIAEAVGKPVNRMCPVDGKAVDPKKVLAHGGKNVGFCCSTCRSKFKKAPDEFKSKVKADAPGNVECPLTGRSIAGDAVHAIDLEYGFCSAGCVRRFERDPGRVLKRIADRERD